MIDLFQRREKPSHIPQDEFDRRAKIMPENRDLGRLPMGVEQHRLINSHFSASQKLFRHLRITLKQAEKPVAKLHPEHGVFHVISRAPHMQLTGHFLSSLPAKLLLDQKEEIFETAVKRTVCPWTCLIDTDKGLKNGGCIATLKQSPFGQHHTMRQVDGVKRG